MNQTMYHVNKKYDDSVHSIVKGISLLCVDEAYRGYAEPTILKFMRENREVINEKTFKTNKTQISSNNSAISGSTFSGP